MIELKNISKCYNEKNKNSFYALNDISFILKDGEVVSLLGHNGAGKTTRKFAKSFWMETILELYKINIICS